MVDTPRLPLFWRRQVLDESTAQTTLLGSSTVLLSTPPGLPPILQEDWPNPRGPRRNPQDWVDGSTWLLTQLAPELPASRQLDWSVPRGEPRNPQDWIAGSGLTLIAPGPQLRAPVLWRKKPPIDRTAALSSPLGSNVVLLSTPPAAALPPANYNWPNPRGSRSNILLGWNDKLIVDILPPPGNYDQPNPRAAWRNSQDWILPTPTPLTAAPADVPPNNQTEWPVPRGSRRNRQDWSDSFKLPLQQVLPPTQKNWPLPTPARKRGPQDWILPVNIALYTTVQIKPPNRQWDWPVPKGPRQPVITTRYFVRGLIPPVAPVYNPDLTLQNEVRRIRFLDNTSGRIRYLKNEIRS